MKTTTLKPGIYRLKCDVTNPQPDRRRTRAWTCDVKATAGTRFVVRDVYEHELYQARTRYEDLDKDDKDDLIAALVKSVDKTREENPDEFLRIAPIYESSTSEIRVVPRDADDQLALFGARILAALEPVPESVGVLLRREEVISPMTNRRPLYALIGDLVDMGKLTLDDVRAAVAVGRDRDRLNDEAAENLFDAHLQRHGFES